MNGKSQTMPAKSQAQRRLMAAAKHGADFPMARKVRASMSDKQLGEFSHAKAKAPEHAPNRYHPSRRSK